MPTLLLVEDEPDLAMATALELGDAGYEVSVVDTGRDAIEVAARLRPQVLLLDWMLRDGLDGVRVAEALAVMDRLPRTILLTAFLSADIRDEAARLGVAEFLQKPVEAQRLVVAVRAVEVSPLPRRSRPGPFAVVEIGSAGELLHVNARAAELFAQTGFAAPPESMRVLFGRERQPDLEAAQARWVAASPAVQTHVNWHLRAGAPRVTGSQLAVILEANQPHYLHESLINTVLGCHPGGRPPCERVLIVDADENSRRLAERVLGSAGIGCLTAATCAHALRLAEQGEPRAVLIDLDSPLAGFEDLVAALRQSHPRLPLLGAASPPHAAALSGLNLDAVLAKPWNLSALLEQLDDAQA